MLIRMSIGSSPIERGEPGWWSATTAANSPATPFSHGPTRAVSHGCALGKLTQNASIESFNSRLRDELLNETLVTGPSPRRTWMLDTTALAARMENPVRVRDDLPPAPESGAALCRRLRASSRRSHRNRANPTARANSKLDKTGGKVSPRHSAASIPLHLGRR